MNRHCKALTIGMLLCQVAHAQWSTSSNNNLYYNIGNVGIGTTVPPATLSIGTFGGSSNNLASTLLVHPAYVLGNTPGSYLYPFELQHNNTVNLDRLQFSPYRRIQGTGWVGTAYRLQFAVDNSFTDGSKAYVEIGASDPTTPAGGFISFGTNGEDRVVVNNQGNVGVGTTTPDAKLAVKGAIHTQEVRVDMNGWADYVLKPAYKLLTLSQVSSYIRQNNRLPDMPSEQQVIMAGVNVGEILKLQTKKIEELTLYLIEKEKQFRGQQQQIQKLKQQQNRRISRLEAAISKLRQRAK